MSVEQNTMSSLRLIQKLQQYVTSTTTDPTLSNSLRTSLEDAAQQTHQFITALRSSSYYTAPTIENDASGPTTLLQFHVRLTGLLLASRVGEERLQSTVTQFNRILSNLLTIDVKISEYQSRNIQGYSPSVNTLQSNIGEFRSRIIRLLELIKELDMRAQTLANVFANVAATFSNLHPEVRNLTDSQFVVDQLRFYSTSVTVKLDSSESAAVKPPLNASASPVQTSVYQYSLSELLCEVGGTIALYFFFGFMLVRVADFLAIRLCHRKRNSAGQSSGKPKTPRSSVASGSNRVTVTAQTASAGTAYRSAQDAVYV